MVNDKYDVDITYADGTEEQQRWIPITQVITTLRAMTEGDDIVVHHVGYAEPDVYYP